MNPLAILKDGFRIAFHTWRLWALTALLYLTLVPTMALSGAFGALSATLSLQSGAAMRTLFGIQLPIISDLAWYGIAAVVLFASVVSGTITWILQAASMRITGAAAEGNRMTIREALSLGRKRILSILKLSLAFGLLLAAIGLLPMLLVLFLSRGDPAGLMLMNAWQTAITPISSILSIFLLLVLLSIALEELRPKAAFGRAWQVVKSGWWGFLLVMAANFLMAIVVAALLLPIALFLFTVLLSGLINEWPGAYWLAGLGCLVFSPIGLALMTFVMVLSTVLYTLTYRSAAALAGQKPPAGP